MNSIALLLTLIAAERRETVVVDAGDATLNLPTSFPLPSVAPPQEAPEPEPIWDAERDRAAAMTGTFILTFPGQPAVKGRVVSQAKGPNRAQRRRR